MGHTNEATENNIQTTKETPLHWRSSHYAVTHVRNKTSRILGRSPNVVKVSFRTIRNCSLKERIRSLWEQILSFKRSSHFEKAHN